MTYSHKSFPCGISVDLILSVCISPSFKTVNVFFNSYRKRLPGCLCCLLFKKRNFSKEVGIYMCSSRRVKDTTVYLSVQVFHSVLHDTLLILYDTAKGWQSIIKTMPISIWNPVRGMTRIFLDFFAYSFWL